MFGRNPQIIFVGLDFLTKLHLRQSDLNSRKEQNVTLTILRRNHPICPADTENIVKNFLLLTLLRRNGHGNVN